MKEYSEKTIKATQKLAKLLKEKKDLLGLKTNVELTNQINIYCEEGVKIKASALDSYLRPRKDGSSVMPSVEKLKAIANFLGYELDELYDILFNDRVLSKRDSDVVKNTIETIKRFPQSEKINLHRFLSEDLYKQILY